MKSTIIYYTFGGNTRIAAEGLKEFLAKRGAVDVIELSALDESQSFFGQCGRAFGHTKAKIAPVNADLSGYDLVCFGTPVWAIGPAPAVNTYLDGCKGLGGKDVVLFATYGSGAGKGRCLDYMQNILGKKGAKKFSRLYIQQFKVKDREFVSAEIRKVLDA